MNNNQPMPSRRTKAQKNATFHWFLVFIEITTLIAILVVLTVVIEKSGRLTELILVTSANGSSEAQRIVAPGSIVDFRSGLELNTKIERFTSEPHKRELLLDHFDAYTGQRIISETIFEKSLNWDVPVALAFGLAWSESRFNTEAINGTHNSNGTRDWGLFQLNDAYRPEWTREDFFDVHKNTEAAMEHFALMLRQFDYKPVLAIAAYNGGAIGIRDGIGFTTLNHISNVIDMKRQLEAEINELMVE